MAGFFEIVQNSSDEWLREQIQTTNRLIHESEQLLRGEPKKSYLGLRELIRVSRVEVREMVEEFRRRKASVL